MGGYQGVARVFWVVAKMLLCVCCGVLVGCQGISRVLYRWLLERS